MASKDHSIKASAIYNHIIRIGVKSQINYSLFQTAEQVTGFCRSPVETRKSSPTGSVASSQSQALLTPSRQLSDAEKLRKVVLELVDTERTYVKVECIISYFLKENYI